MNAMKLAATALITLAAAGAHAADGARYPARMADVNIVDRTTGRTLPIYWHDGQAYVAGKPGNEYSVTVRNRQGVDLLAVVSVDGVNVLTGQTANAGQGGYVVSSWARLDIKGWRKNLGETASFYFTSLGDSYAARTDRPDDVGVIGVALFERARPAPPPVAEAAPYRDNMDSRRERAPSAGGLTAKSMAVPSAPAATAPAAPGEPLGTGHGRRESSPVRYVDFDRATREPVDTIVIRYDSYPNLVAMGVIPTYGQTREPRAFPGTFVPDPWR